MDLEVDEQRILDGYAEPNGEMGTGIFVRAKRGGQWGTHDICALTRDSLIAWLRGAEAQAPLSRAENVVLLLLGYRR